MQSGKIIFSAPDTRPSLQHAARALHEAGMLGAYYTTMAFSQDATAIRAAEFLDGVFHTSFAVELRRRAIREFPASLVRRFPKWDIPRTLLSRLHFNERTVDYLHFRSLEALDRHVAAKLNACCGVYGVNLASEAAFAAAKPRGIACIYEIVALEARSYIRMLHEEFGKFPELFATATPIEKVAERYIRRCDAEWKLADLVIVNSDLTRESYAAAGFNVKNVRVVPLGFPPTSAETVPRPAQSGPLNVLWAGNFSVSKGAHYLLAALKLRQLRGSFRVRVFGKMLLPAVALEGLQDSIQFNGSIPHTQLFDEYRRGDVLVLPTLSDGFGMVISEAMSQGLPVITTRLAGAAQFIESEKNGLIIPPKNPEALAAALIWCADHPDDLRAMGEAARRTAASWQWSNYREAVVWAVMECTGHKCYEEMVT
jgi:glycosyltransferase involved in cell wall biosynthesis